MAVVETEIMALVERVQHTRALCETARVNLQNASEAYRAAEIVLYKAQDDVRLAEIALLAAADNG
jgi:hypothetical protein